MLILIKGTEKLEKENAKGIRTIPVLLKMIQEV